MNEPTTLQLTLNERDTIRIPLLTDTLAQSLSLPLAALDSMAFESLELQFDGGYPEINGIGMWTDSGIVVHNFAMRGSSGTVFRQLDRDQFSRQLGAIRTELVMLQYGGNTVPYIEDAERAAAIWSMVHVADPLVPIPLTWCPHHRDWAVGHGAQSGDAHGNLPPTHLCPGCAENGAINSDALYWDMFEVMGGEGSMAAWVQSEPPLASSDHIHFTPTGAKQIAELFRQSIQAEWTLWQNTQAEQTLVHAP